MSRRVNLHALLLILSLTYFSILIPFTNAIQIDITGQVSWVHDGDTFDIDSGSTAIRLADIDAPEYGYPGYDDAKWYLHGLVYEKTVYLDQSTLNGYSGDRLVCVVYIDYDSENYLNVNKQMIDSGYAAQIDYPNDFNPNTWTLLIPKSVPPTPVTYTLTIQAPSGSGSTNPNTGTYSTKSWENRQITASPASGWSFDHWTVDGLNSGSSTTLTVTMNSDHSVKAYFIQNTEPPTPPPPTPPPTPPPEPPPTPPPPTTYTLTIKTEGSGVTDPVPATYSYEEGIQVTIRQTPSEDWMLSHWLLDNATLKANTITITLNQNHDVMAIFIEKSPDCKITFKTADSSGTNIEGVTVKSTTQPLKQKAIELTTNTDGEAVTDLIYYGHYIFNLSKYGYDSATKEINLDSGEQPEVVVSLLESPIDLRIVVNDLEGALLVDVSITSIAQPVGQSQVSGYTNESGIILFVDVKPGSYWFKISGLWVREEIEQISVKLGDASQSYQASIQSLCGLKLSVVDDQGNRLDGVKVETLAYPLGQMPMTEIIDGDLLFNNIMPGNYTIRFTKDGYTPVDRSMNLGVGYTNDMKLVVLVKPWSQVILDNALSILSIVVLFLVVTGYLIMRKNRGISVPDLVSGAKSTQVTSVVPIEPILVEPKYFGSTKGSIIKAVTVDGKHDLTELKRHLQLPEQDFSHAFYELLMIGELIGTNKGTFEVRDETRDQWIRYFESKDRS